MGIQSNHGSFIERRMRVGEAIRLFSVVATITMIATLTLLYVSCHIAYDNSACGYFSEETCSSCRNMPLLVIALVPVFGLLSLLSALNMLVAGLRFGNICVVAIFVSLLLGVHISISITVPKIRETYRKTAIRLRPLVEAIHRYAKENGAPPKKLSDLVPEYIEQVPSSGIPSAREVQYSFDGQANDEWTLDIDALHGLSFDRFFYSPVKPQGPGYELIEEWVYFRE